MSQDLRDIRESDINDFEDHIGETVTIFTTSGGRSGSGFTGVIIAANRRIVRLVTRIGPAPGCALGNSCDDEDDRFDDDRFDDCDRDRDRDRDRNRRGGFSGGFGSREGRDDRDRDRNRDRDRRRRRDDFVSSVGSVVEIPVDRIAAVVFNSI
jgi:hypothetical protein